MEQYRMAGIIVMAAAVTFLLRALPFLVFRKKQSMPAELAYLGKVLPSAIMAILIVYCMRNISICNADSMAMILAALITAVSYIWKRNAFLSIVGGTAFYMLFCQK